MEETDEKVVKKSMKFVKTPRNMKAGLIGLTNVGKTSVFNLLTDSHGPVDESCFCTIDPNYATKIFYDQRLETISKLIGSAKSCHPSVSILDTAGLVRNAHEDAGLGNEFLSMHQALDILIHVVRGFQDQNVTHVEGLVDPFRDIVIVTEELLAKDIEIATFALTTMEFTVNKGSCGREILYEYETLCKAYQVLTGTEYIPKKGGPAYLRGGGSVGSKSTSSKSKGSAQSQSTKSEKKIATATVNSASREGQSQQPPLPPINGGGQGDDEEEEEIRGRPIRYHMWEKSQRVILMKYKFLTAKEMVYLLNIAPRDYLRYTLHSLNWIDELISSVTRYFTYSSPAAAMSSINSTSSPSSPNIRVIVMSVAFEESYLQESLHPETFQHYQLANPYHQSALGKIFQSLYSQMDLIPFYTATPTECKVYYVPEGTMAPEAGGHVDSEIERKFICANVMSFDDLVEFENEFTLRRMGKLVQQGRKYLVNEGDIISFQHSK